MHITCSNIPTKHIMAAEAKTDDSQPKFEEIINVDGELSKRRDIINIALTPLDDSWTRHNTKNESISVAYKQFENSNVYTVRGVMTMTGVDINVYYKYLECGYNDAYIKSIKNDENTTENRIVKLVDDDHQIVYNSSNSGFWIVAPRDFTYIRTRFKETEYQFGDLTYSTIIGSLAYSIEEDHPLNVPTKKDHVRAHLTMNGYVLSQSKNAKNGEFEVCYILAMDPKGMIPQWVVNSFAPSKGMEIKKFVEDWPNMVEMVKQREANGFKRDHEPLFDAQNPKLMFIEKTEEELKGKGGVDDEKEAADPDNL